MAEEIHKKHRERVFAKFLAYGLDVFQDHETLEFLLFFAIPRGDTNGTAHRLLNRFRSLHAVFEAPLEQLREVEGIGLRSAVLIKLVHALCIRYRVDRANTERNADRLDTIERVHAYFIPQLCHETQEVLLAAYLDNSGRVIKCEECARGSVTQVTIDINHIARTALLCNAAGVALAHCHPCGRPIASEEDISVTRRLEHVLNELHVQLVEHCIVAGEKCCSLRRQLWRNDMRR